MFVDLKWSVYELIPRKNSFDDSISHLVAVFNTESDAILFASFKNKLFDDSDITYVVKKQTV